MDRPEFDITVDKDGKLHVQVKGVHGRKCMELADLIRDIVGTEESRKATSEFYGLDEQVRMNVQVKQKRD